MTSSLSRPLIIPTLLSAGLVYAAYRVLGLPNGRDVEGFFGGSPTTAGTLATTEALVWVVVSLVLMANLFAFARAAGRDIDVRRRRRAWAASVLVLGLCLLAGGVIQSAPRVSPQLCCGSVVDAQRELHR
jgi:hypothetical protein